MISHTDLARLATIRSSHYPIVSFYLNIDAHLADEAKHVIRMRNLLDLVSAAGEGMDGEQSSSLEHDIGRIRDYLRDQAVASHVGTAIIASHGSGIWETFVFDQPLANHASVGPEPYLLPLYQVIAAEYHAATVLVEQGKARLFLVSRESVREVTDVYTDVPARHDQGGWSQARLQRHHDEHVLRHLKATAEHLFALFQGEGFDHLFLSGTEPITGALRGLLHPYLASRVGGTMTLPLTSTSHEVQAATLVEIQRLAGERDQATVRHLLGEVGSEQRGVAGLAATQSAVQRGQVATLVIVKGLLLPGWHAPALDYYTILPDDPVCSDQEVQAVSDVIGPLVAKTYEHGGAVVVVSDPEARAQIEAHGGVGALLRFRVPSHAGGSS